MRWGKHSDPNLALRSLSATDYIVCVIVMAVLQIDPPLWWYQRDSMLIQPWRWFTAHWVHLNWIHFALNSTALVCLAFIFKLPRVTFWLMILMLSLWISWLCYFYLPVLEGYAGLSGVLHGMYTWAAWHARHHEPLFSSFVLFGIFTKLIYEYRAGNLGTEQLIGYPVLNIAHLWGAIGAMILGLILLVIKRIQQANFR